jgi:BirA family biotin operon repressor/biotin-[acetyl-CoA-carboxylase] ligase
MAGMLTEAHLDSSRVYGIIFGIGLNVNLRKESLPEELKKKTTSLCMEIDGDKALDINRVGAELLLSLEQAYDRFLEGTHTFLLHQAWNALDYLYGKNVTAVFGEERLIGNASGIDEQGRILIKDTAGTLHAFSAGDVTLNTGT